MTFFTERKNCMFCENSSLTTLLESNKSIPIACYSHSLINREAIFIPYNIVSCDACKTIQTKYLGDLNCIYGGNHANVFGTTRNEMNILFSDFILNSNNCGNILEIGAGNGDICDYILNKNNSIEYTIVDPSYWGKSNDRIVVYSYFEEYDISNKNINSIVMSHVFEHFYNPLKILQKIKDSTNINRVYLNFPDLESFIKYQNYHVLNPEHIYYTENSFIIDIFRKFGFSLVNRYDYNNFAVFFEFIRSDSKAPLNIVNTITEETTCSYFNKLNTNIVKANSIMKTNASLPVYIWPSSMHTNFVISFGLNKDRIINVLDNSPNKIGKYLYGYNLLCKSFTECIQSVERKIIILAGGSYNKEILSSIPLENNIVIVL